MISIIGSFDKNNFFVSKIIKILVFHKDQSLLPSAT